MIGGLIGLFAGLLTSYMLVQQSEKRQNSLSLTATDGVKMGLGLMTFMRLISEIFNRD